MNSRNPSYAGTLPPLALIGCGALSERFYLPALNSLSALKERMIIVDRDRHRVKMLADKYGFSRFTTDYKELLGELKGAIVAVPHHLHHTVSKDLLSAKAHVLCEKPLAENSSDVRELIDLARSNNVTLSVNNTRRLLPTSAKVKELLTGGAIGEPLEFKHVEGNAFTWPAASGFYFDSRISPRGVLLDLGAHVFDLVCWWFGGKPAILSSQNDSFGGCEAVASVHFRYKHLTGEVWLSRLARLENTYKIIGTDGSIEVAIFDPKRMWITDKSRKRKEISLSPSGKFSEIGRLLVENFVNVIDRSDRPLIPAGDAVASIETIDEAYNMASPFPMPWYQFCMTRAAHD